MKYLLTALGFWLAIQNVSNEDICEPVKDSVFSMVYYGCKQVFLCEKNKNTCGHLSYLNHQYITNYELKVPEESCVSLERGCPVLQDGVVDILTLYPKGWLILKFQEGFVLTHVKINIRVPAAFWTADINFDNGHKIQISPKSASSIALPSGAINSSISVNISVNFKKKNFKHPTLISFYGITDLMKCNIKGSLIPTIGNPIEECLSRDMKMQQMYESNQAELIMYDYVNNTESDHKSKPKSELTTRVSNTADATNTATTFSDKNAEIIEISTNSGSGMGVDVINRNTEAFTNLPRENSHLLTVVTSSFYSNSSLAVNTVSTSVPKCFCACPKTLSESWLRELEKELKLNKKNTSRYLASKISAKDDRLSSQFIGGVSIAIMVSLGGFICIPDLLTLAYFLSTKLTR